MFISITNVMSSDKKFQESFSRFVHISFFENEHLFAKSTVDRNVFRSIVTIDQLYIAGTIEQRDSQAICPYKRCR